MLQLLNKPQHSLKDCPGLFSLTVYYVSTTQSSNLVVSVVEHVYRMIASLLYTTSRNSPDGLVWGYSWRLGLGRTQNGQYHEVYVHIKQIICLRILCVCFLLLSGMTDLIFCYLI